MTSAYQNAPWRKRQSLLTVMNCSRCTMTQSIYYSSHQLDILNVIWFPLQIDFSFYLSYISYATKSCTRVKYIFVPYKLIVEFNNSLLISNNIGCRYPKANITISYNLLHSTLQCCGVS